MCKKRVILIIGAGSGIGKGLAERFVQSNEIVINADIGNKGSEIKFETHDNYSEIYIDVTKKETIENVISGVNQSLGRLDTIIYTAAPPRSDRKDFPENISSLQKEFEVLILGALWSVSSSMGLLEKSNSASIILVGSILSSKVAHETIGYHVCKAGLVQAARYLAFNLGPKGIRVNVVSPGVVRREVSLSQVSFKQNSDFDKILKQITPMQRSATYDDIFNFIQFLVSEKASYITGEDFFISGGMSLSEQFNISRQVLSSRET